MAILVEQLYNIDSYKEAHKMVKEAVSNNKSFADAYNGLAFQHALEAVDPKVFNKKYPENTFLNMAQLTVDNSGGWAETVKSLRISEQGSFENTKQNSSNSGKISIFGDSSDITVVERSAFSLWTRSDLEQAAMQQINLTDRLVSAHNKIYTRELDEIGYLGDKKSKKEGILNYEGFTVDSGSAIDNNANPQEIYDQIAQLITDQWNNAYNTPSYMATECHMPVSVYNIISNKIINSASGSKSVLKALQDNFANVNFTATSKAEDVKGSRIIVALNPGEDVMKFRLPQPLMLGNIIQQTSHKWRMDSIYRFAGIDILENAGGRLLRNI